MHVFSGARIRLQDPVPITDLKGMSLLSKTSSREGLSCYEPQFYHLGLQVSMWPSAGGLWEGRCPFLLRTSQQLAWLLLLSALPGGKHLPLHLAYFVYFIGRFGWWLPPHLPQSRASIMAYPAPLGHCSWFCTTGVCPSPQKQHPGGKELNQGTPSSRLVIYKLSLSFSSSLGSCWSWPCARGCTCYMVKQWPQCFALAPLSPAPAEDHKPVKDHFPLVLIVYKTAVLS